MAKYIRINAHCVFLLDASCDSWELLVGSLDVSTREINYVAAVQDGQRQWGLLFVTVAPPGTLEVVKALPGSSEHFFM